MGGQLPGTKAHLSCNRNFAISVEPFLTTRTCQANGAWTYRQPTCNRRCEYFEIQHGSELYSQYEQSNGGYKPGTIVIFSCDPGYTLKSTSGHDYNRCANSGYWTFTHPQCIKEGNRRQ